MTYELQELTTDCANQLRSSRTEYDSDTNPNIVNSWDSGPVLNRGITCFVMKCLVSSLVFKSFKKGRDSRVAFLQLYS